MSARKCGAIIAFSFASAVFAGEPLVSLDFEEGTAANNQFTKNFRVCEGGGTASQTDPADADEANNDYIEHLGSGRGGRTLIYDTTPRDGTKTRDTFNASIVVQFDLSCAQEGSSCGVYIVDPRNEQGNNALLAIIGVNYEAEKTDRIRFFKKAVASTVSAGTEIESARAVGDAGVNPSPDSAPEWGTVTVRYNVLPGNVPQLSLSVGDLTSTVTYTAQEFIPTPEIALRLYDPKSDPGGIRVDNLQIKLP